MYIYLIHSGYLNQYVCPNNKLDKSSYHRNLSVALHAVKHPRRSSVGNSRKRKGETLNKGSLKIPRV